MTPPIIFKQRHFGAETHRKNTPSSNAVHIRYIGEREHVLLKAKNNNAEHVKYIGEREHVAINKTAEIKDDKVVISDSEVQVGEEMITKTSAEENQKEVIDISGENGLFGYIGGKFSDDYYTSEMMRYVEKRTSPHRDIFRCVFSFTPESAEQAGLTSIEKWQAWVKYHMSEVAANMNMKIENVEYLAAVHLKEGQPHVHIMYWDLNQQVAINKVDPEICDAIRVAVTKSTYRDYFNELHNKEDKLTKELRQTIAEGVSEERNKQAAAMLEDISTSLPRKGQLVYKLMPPEVKEKINALTHFMINNDSSAFELYNQILEQRKLYNEMLHSEKSKFGRLQLSKFMGRLNYDIEKEVGNAILRLIVAEKKKTNQSLKSEPKRYQSGRRNVNSIAYAIMNILKSHSQENDDAIQGAAQIVFGRGDLSKEQIAEIIYKNCDKENTSEI